MPWWGKSEAKPDATATKGNDDASRKEPFDANKLPESRKLPEGLQKIVDKADQDNSFFDEIVEGL